jgi:hypothetical protein
VIDSPTNVRSSSCKSRCRSIELKKENWDLAVYPVENHAFTKASSWADEYKRIFKSFETNLKAKSSSSN